MGGTEGRDSWTQRAGEVQREGGPGGCTRPSEPRWDFHLDLKRDGRPLMCLKQGRRGEGVEWDLHFRKLSLAG